VPTYVCDGVKGVTILNGVARIEFHRRQTVERGSGRGAQMVSEMIVHCRTRAIAGFGDARASARRSDQRRLAKARRAGALGAAAGEIAENFVRAQSMRNCCNRGPRVVLSLAALTRAAGLAAAVLLAVPGIGAAGAVVPGPGSAEIAAGPAAAHLPEPLVATGPTNAGEDAALLAAVMRYQNRADADDFFALSGFLAAYPHSPWPVAILTNLGIVYLHYGYFSRAIEAWQAA
jgi:hypothetical protein